MDVDAAIAGAVARWFARNARELPWRVEWIGGEQVVVGKRGVRHHAERGGTQIQRLRRDPYLALVAEAMLQQTQVSRVIEKYGEFVGRFPTVEALAAADEHEVLGLWTGLGYYRRARNLHAAAKMVVAEFGGSVPRGVEELQKLPGVGRYTAGAIASIAHGERAPIVDGNVARVLLRVHGKGAASDDKSVRGWLWERADAMVQAADEPGVFNEGMMELGATVCVPGTPRCGECPLREMCVARREGRELDIPRPKARTARKDVHCAVVVIRRGDGAMVVEQRGDDGMWAGMWQAPTIERADRPPTATEVGRAVGVTTKTLERTGTFEFLATHRRMVFDVYWVGVAEEYVPRRGEFRGRAAIARLGMSSPQRRVVLEMQ